VNYLGLAKLALSGRDARSISDNGGCESNESREPLKSSQARLFRERRRTRPLEDSWHEALVFLNRMLRRYEETTSQLRESEENHRGLFEEALVGIFQLSPSGRPLRVNRAMATIHGYESPEQFMTEVSNARRRLLVSRNHASEWKGLIGPDGTACGITAEVYRRDGSKRWVSLNVRVVRDERGRIVRFAGTSEDITDRKAAQDRMQYLAYYDALTGLPNRTLFKVQLKDALTAARARGVRAALLLLEIDRFKIVDDSFGHSMGDRLLQQIAERIRRGAGEQCVVARIAGAEFAILQENLADAQQAAETVKKLTAELAAEFCILEHTLNISFSFGVSIFPDHGADGEELLQNADVANFSAREEGPNKFRFFTEEMSAKIMEQLRLENGLRVAIDRKELFLLYQPQVNIRTGAITGVEALLRWQHPQLGLVAPGRFIGIAESSGLIVPIGEWVLRTACAQARKWQDAGHPPVPVAVNVSAIQFRQQGFPELIRSTLRETGLDPKYLELELTETLLLSNADVMFSILQELRGMGVRLAIDDFGSGYSSLSYLRQFQVNRLKIDRSFVRDVAMNRDDAAITTAIIRMAKALNLEVIAEGVENEAQLTFLREQHCFDVQGFYFSRSGPQIVLRSPTLSPEKRRKDGARNLSISAPDQ
jgi:diguanylate cyclase (GGDEF)-like protein/PAS domain S-box-containing protein